MEINNFSSWNDRKDATYQTLALVRVTETKVRLWIAGFVDTNSRIVVRNFEKNR